MPIKRFLHVPSVVMVLIVSSFALAGAQQTPPPRRVPEGSGLPQVKPTQQPTQRPTRPVQPIRPGQPLQQRTVVPLRQPVQQRPMVQQRTVQPVRPIPQRTMPQTVQPRTTVQPRPAVQPRTVQPRPVVQPVQRRPVGQPQPVAHSIPPRVVPPRESQQRIQALNQNRRGMTGINSRPLPKGQLSTLPNGHHVIETNSGARMQVRPNGSVEQVTLHDGRTASFHSNGQLAAYHAPGLQINHGLRGERTIVTESNGRRLVGMGPHQGYMERPFLSRNGRTYNQRTYWTNGHSYARVYRDREFHGAHYDQYVPGHYYRPGFYNYAYGPWPAPVRYQWGWQQEPWAASSSSYFQPSSSYSSAPAWLTDNAIAGTLRNAYGANPGGGPGGIGSGGSPVTPEVKNDLEGEVRADISDEQREAVQPGGGPAGGPETPPDALSSEHLYFVVDNNLSVATGEGPECELTGGDVINRVDDAPGEDNSVHVKVLSSKPQDCSAGTTASVGVSDLQEMHNTLREQVDAGLDTLANNKGAGGIPPATDPATLPGEVPPPAPDANIDGRLQDQDKQGTLAEGQVQQEIQTETM